MIAAVTIGCRAGNTAKHVPKLIVLGVDGMDPGFIERHWDELPNLRRLRAEGQFLRLATTMPPQSPVAWSTFITGHAPAQHGIFDFVHRNATTLEPFSSFARTEPSSVSLPLGPYIVPLSPPRIVALRQGQPFWKRLSDSGVPVTVIRMPTNYPPIAAGQAIAGMGVPDLSGTLGTFNYFTDDPAEYSREVTGGRIRKIQVANGRAILPVPGPVNSLRKDGLATSADLIIDVDPNVATARIAIGDALTVLREGEWSGWLPLQFTLIPHLSTVQGMVRVYVKQLHPRLAIYTTPANVDPVSPALPLSFPAGFSRTLAHEIGRFSTLGIPEDTAALRNGILNRSEFQAQANGIFEEEHRELQFALHHFSAGFLFFYFSSVDQNSHMLWGRYDAELLKVYRSIDRAIGETRAMVPDAELIVMSDHGFAAFDRAVHLNTWLRNRGFLSTRTAGSGTLADADWSATEAYGMGLNGLYLNLRGREAHGSIEPGEPARALLANLQAQLLAWRDPLNGAPVVTVVAAAHAAPQNANVAPDLSVGYAPGYRASWQTALGGLGEQEIEPNTDSWLADHCIDPADVPGVLFTSRKQSLNKPALQDVTAMILKRYGLE